MVEPATAAIATLATIAGVSGYGAMKVNKDQDVVIEQKVHERIAQTEERLKQTQEALQAVEAIKAKQDAQLADIQRELNMLRSAKANLQQTKTKPERRALFTSRFTPVVPEPGMAQPEPTTVTPDEITVTPQPEPEPVSVPTPVTAPEPVSIPTPVTAPEPVSLPTPVTAPEPVSVPATPDPQSVPASPEVVPTPVSIPAPDITAEPASPAPSQPTSVPEDKTVFEPRQSRSLEERLRIAKEQAAKLKEDNVPKGFMSRLESAKGDALQDVVNFAATPPVEPYRYTPTLESPVNALTATVPSRYARRPPAPPAFDATRRNRRPVRAPPVPSRGGVTRLTRKKKLRTRRGGKQKNVGRTRGR